MRPYNVRREQLIKSIDVSIMCYPLKTQIVLGKIKTKLLKEYATSPSLSFILGCELMGDISLLEN